jgi:hypothetical protein
VTLRIAGILPFRLLLEAQNLLKQYRIDFPDPDKSKKENRKLIESAHALIAFLDDKALEQGRSIGTKVEIANNMSKIIAVLKYDKRVFVPIRMPVFDEPLPTWDEYVGEEE